MFDIPSTADELQAALDVVNAQRLRELSRRARAAGYVLTLSLDPAEEYSAEDLVSFDRPLQERLDSVEEDISDAIYEDLVAALTESLG